MPRATGNGSPSGLSPGYERSSEGDGFGFSLMAETALTLHLYPKIAALKILLARADCL